MVQLMKAYQHTCWASHAASSSRCRYGDRHPRLHYVGPGRVPNNLTRLSHRDFNEDRSLAIPAADIPRDQQQLQRKKKTKLSVEAQRNRDLDIAPLLHGQLRQKRILVGAERIRDSSRVSARFSRFGAASSEEQEQQANRPIAVEARRGLSARAMAAADAAVEAGVEDSSSGGVGSGAPTAPEVGSWYEQAMERVLWSAEELDRRVEELATAISTDFPGDSLVFVGVATGAFMFLADLVRKLKVPVTVDLIRVRSYGTGTNSSGVANLMTDIRIEVENKHVILVEDIIDTGITLSTLVAHFSAKGVATVSVCALLDKKARRVVPLQLADGGKFYSGFECPDLFVVGYGMDYAENFRSLPYVGVLKRHVYEKK